MAKTKKLVKPVKKVAEPYWDYNEVAHYLEQLHGKNFRDYAGRFESKKHDDSIPYQDFWHWICDQNDSFSNGSWIHLPDWSYYTDEEAATEPWKKEIMQYFYDFLGEDYHGKLWVQW